MKLHACFAPALAVAISAAAFSSATAQTSVTTATGVDGTASVTATSTTTAVGTISEYTPSGLLIASQSGGTPMRYGITKTTTYVDESGAPIAPTMIKPGIPVTVHYAQQGGQTVV